MLCWKLEYIYIYIIFYPCYFPKHGHLFTMKIIENISKSSKFCPPFTHRSPLPFNAPAGRMDRALQLAQQLSSESPQRFLAEQCSQRAAVTRHGWGDGWWVWVEVEVNIGLLTVMMVKEDGSF